jgi:hypothetical protein
MGVLNRIVRGVSAMRGIKLAESEEDRIVLFTRHSCTMKSRRMRLAGHIALRGEKRNLFKFRVENLQGKNST